MGVERNRRRESRPTAVIVGWRDSNPTLSDIIPLYRRGYPSLDKFGGVKWVVVLVGLVVVPSVAASLGELAGPVGLEMPEAPVDGEDASGFGEAPEDEPIDPMALLPEDILGVRYGLLLPSQPQNSAFHGTVVLPDVAPSAEEGPAEPAADPVLEEPVMGLELQGPPEEPQSFESVPIVPESEAPDGDVPASPAPSPMQPNAQLPLEPANPEVPLMTLLTLGGLAVFLLALLGALAKGLQRIFTMPWWSLFSHVDRGEAMAHPNRQRLLAQIQAQPGSTQPELMAALDMSRSNVAYHLEVLERHDLIHSSKIGRRKHFFVPSSKDCERFALLRHERRQQIAQFILENPLCNQRAICKALGMHQSRVNAHVQSLHNAGLVKLQPRQRSVQLQPTEQLVNLWRLFFNGSESSGPASLAGSP